MKKLLATISALFLITPLSAFAAAEVSASPAGTTKTNPMTLSVYLPEAQDQQDVITQCGGGNSVSVFLQASENDPFVFSGTYTLPADPADPYVPVTYTFSQMVTPGIYSGEFKWFCNDTDFEIAGASGEPEFTVITNANKSFSVPITFVPAFTANVSETIAGAGFSAVMLYSIAIVVLFWVMTRIIGVIRSPADREGFDMKRFKSEADRIEHDYRDLRRFSEEFGKIGDEYRDKNTRK